MKQIFPPDDMVPLAIEWGALLNVRDGQWYAPQGDEFKRLLQWSAPDDDDDYPDAPPPMRAFEMTHEEFREYVLYVSPEEEDAAAKKGVYKDKASGVFRGRSGIKNMQKWMTAEANMRWHRARRRGRGITEIIMAVLRLARGVTMLLSPVPKTAPGRRRWIQSLKARPVAEVRQSMALTSREISRLSRALESGKLKNDDRWRGVRRISELTESLELAKEHVVPPKRQDDDVRQMVARHLVKRATEQYGAQVSNAALKANISPIAEKFTQTPAHNVAPIDVLHRSRDYTFAPTASSVRHVQKNQQQRPVVIEDARRKRSAETPDRRETPWQEATQTVHTDPSPSAQAAIENTEPATTSAADTAKQAPPATAADAAQLPENTLGSGATAATAKQETDAFHTYDSEISQLQHDIQHDFVALVGQDDSFEGARDLVAEREQHKLEKGEMKEQHRSVHEKEERFRRMQERAGLLRRAKKSSRQDEENDGLRDSSNTSVLAYSSQHSKNLTQ